MRSSIYVANFPASVRFLSSHWCSSPLRWSLRPYVNACSNSSSDSLTICSATASNACMYANIFFVCTNVLRLLYEFCASSVTANCFSSWAFKPAYLVASWFWGVLTMYHRNQTNAFPRSKEAISELKHSSSESKRHALKYRVTSNNQSLSLYGSSSKVSVAGTWGPTPIYPYWKWFITQMFASSKERKILVTVSQVLVLYTDGISLQCIAYQYTILYVCILMKSVYCVSYVFIPV